MNDEQKSLLIDARAREDWTFLWQAAVPLVKLAMRRLMEDGRLDPYYSREDLLQDGYLAAGEAVRRWEPERGAFSTWVVAKVRGALLNSIQAASTGMVGGRPSGFHVIGMHADSVLENPYRQDENREFGHEATMQYDEPPETFGDPANESTRAEEIAKIRSLLSQLPDDDRHMLQALYGIDSEEYTQEEYAKLRGIPERTIRRQLASAKSFLAGLD